MFDLTTLNGTNGFSVPGVNAKDYLGAIGTAGDVNGDGLSDLVLGAWAADSSGQASAGTAYVIFGQVSGWSTSFDLATLNGSDGFRVEGLNAYDNLGYSVSTAGDMNGDRLSDLVLGAPGADLSGRNNTGTVYVIFGQTNNTWPASFNLTTLDGSNGFRVEGLNAGDWLGRSISTAGDMNGDGRSDLVLGAWAADHGGEKRVGTAYVIFGQTSGWLASFSLTTLNGSNGFHVEGVNADNKQGVSVSTAGDMNGDGLSDLVLGAYVVFGQASGWLASFNLTTLDGSNGFRVERVDTYSVSTAGDMNSDGLSDLVLGAQYVSPVERYNAGTAYVVFGQASGWPAFFNLTTLDGSNGFRVEGLNMDDYLGYSVSTADDMNGDGQSDLVLEAYGADPGGRSYAGTAYVIFGQASGWQASFNLTTLNGSNGFRVGGMNAYDYLGYSVSTAGDVNGDGQSDLVLGAPGVGSYAGTAYVLFGPVAVTPNRPPQLIHNLPNQTVEFASSFVLQNVSNAFIDPDDNILTYSAAPSDNSILPSWLTLDAATGFFFGTSNQTGITLLTVTAADPYGLTASANFSLTVSCSPQLIYPLPDKTVEFEKPFTFLIAPDTFIDPDGDGLTYSAAQLRNYTLPSWLKFNATTIAFSGISNQTGTTLLKVTAADPYGLTASADFSLAVSQFPKLIHRLPDKTAELKKPFSFQIASNIFIDPDGDALTYSAAQSGNYTLPSWLKFNRVTGAGAIGIFSGTPDQTGITPITVTATDPYGLTATADFNLSVQDQTSTIDVIIGSIVGGVAALGGLAGAAYLAYKRGFFTSSNRGENNHPASPDIDIELTKKTVISLAG